jgi:hypothetical protein
MIPQEAVIRLNVPVLVFSLAVSVMTALCSPTDKSPISCRSARTTVKGRVKNILSKLAAIDRTHAVTIGSDAESSISNAIALVQRRARVTRKGHDGYPFRGFRPESMSRTLERGPIATAIFDIRHRTAWRRIAVHAPGGWLDVGAPGDRRPVGGTRDWPSSFAPLPSRSRHASPSPGCGRL